jgi:hypothetical protein
VCACVRARVRACMVRRKRAIETVLHVLFACEALGTLKFRHVGQLVMKPGDSDDIFFDRILSCVQSAGLLNVSAKGLHKRLITVEVPGSLQDHPCAFCSIQFHSVFFYMFSWVLCMRIPQQN